MKILITGISSFVGSYTAAYLLEQGHEVYGIVRPASRSMHRLRRHENLYIITRDLQDIEQMNAGVLPAFALCLHFAWDGVGAAGRMDAAVQEKNLAASLALIRKCGELGVQRFVFAGSQAEYGQTLENHREGSCDEYCAEHPLSLYGKTKLEMARRGSALCRELGMEYIHLRIFSVYGYGDHSGSLLSSCLSALRDDKEESAVFGECTQLWNYLYVKDCAAAIGELVQKKDLAQKMESYTKEYGPLLAGEEAYRRYVLNVAGTDTRPLRDFVMEAARLYQREDLPRFVPREAGAEGIAFLHPDIRKLQTLTGFKQKFSFEEGIRDIENLYHLQREA